MKDLDILKKMLSNLTDKEKAELLGTIEKSPPVKKKVKNLFLEMDLDEDPRIVEDSKKLNKTVKKQPRTRPDVKMVEVTCANCGKKYTVAENFPGINQKFICCI